MKKIIVFTLLFASVIAAQNDTAEDTTAKPAITASTASRYLHHLV